MKPPPLPAYELRKRKLHGSPHTVHAIFVGGVCVREQLSPMSDAEIESHVRAHLAPKPASRLDDMKKFHWTEGNAKPGRKKKPGRGKDIGLS